MHLCRDLNVINFQFLLEFKKSILLGLFILSLLIGLLIFIRPMLQIRTQLLLKVQQLNSEIKSQANKIKTLPAIQNNKANFFPDFFSQKTLIATQPLDYFKQNFIVSPLVLEFFNSHSFYNKKLGYFQTSIQMSVKGNFKDVIKLLAKLFHKKNNFIIQKIKWNNISPHLKMESLYLSLLFFGNKEYMPEHFHAAKRFYQANQEVNTYYSVEELCYQGYLHSNFFEKNWGIIFAPNHRIFTIEEGEILGKEKIRITSISEKNIFLENDKNLKLMDKPICSNL